MISTAKWPARVAASALLPLAVGPMSRIAAGSAATHEEFVEIGEADLKPSRAAMVALAGALGFLHLAQQGVHLQNGQGPMGAHRTVAGHRSEQLVPALGEHAARPVFADVPQYRARKLRRIGLGQHGRDRTYREREGRDRRHVETELVEGSAVLLDGGDVDPVGVERGGDKQLLGVHRAGVERSLESFVKDALVRGMHVDQYQALLVLREYVYAVQLREREAERRCTRRVRVFERRARQREVSGRASVGEHRGIARYRLSEAQGNLVCPGPYRAARCEGRGDRSRSVGRRAGKTLHDRMKHELG